MSPHEPRGAEGAVLDAAPEASTPKSPDALSERLASVASEIAAGLDSLTRARALLAEIQADVERLSQPKTKPLPATWAPSGRTRILLAGQGIDAGPKSDLVRRYHEAMHGQERARWTENEFKAWAQAQKGK